MRVQIDRNVCIGCGACEDLCPEVFHLVEGCSTVLLDPIPPNLEGQCEKAAKNCPVEAILLDI